MAFSLKSLFKGAAKALPMRFNAWTLGGHGAEIFEKSAEALELERLNPLRGVDEWRLGQIFDDARDGIYADLAWLYNEIEGVEPALSACCDMRESAASECGWLVKTADADRARGFDEKLADEQRVALLAEFGAVEDDLAELAGHLVTAFFRGAAHAQPLWNADGTLAGFRHLDLWNLAYDKQTGIWYWNADASRDEATFQPIPPGEIVSLASSRHVDHAALPIFIRAALGAKRYGVWLDRFGIPPVGVVMPPSAEKSDQASYMDLARKFARGGSGILPNGSSVVYGTEARAVCPFIDFIRFQQQQIYTLGIGRVQSGETDGANLGGNAAGVVEDGFRRIVRRDGRRIARAINDCVTRKVLARLFPGKPVLAQFAWDTDAKRTGSEVLADAVTAKNAGLAIDIGQLQELTGYKLTKAEEGTGNGERGTGFPGFGFNKNHSPFPDPRFPSLQTAPESFKTGRSEPDGQGEVETAPALLGPFLRALQSDCKMIAGEVEELLKDPTPEKARALLDKIPDLVPEDPALAPLLAEEMAKAYGEAWVGRAVPGKPKEEVVNFNPEQPRGQPDNAGQFASTGGSSGAPPESTEAKKIEVGSVNTDSPEEQERQLANAATAFEKCLNEQIDVPNAFHRSDIGDIDLRWGKTNKGLKHMIERRDAFAASHPGALDGRAVLSRMPETIIKGTVTEVTQSGGHPHIVIERNGFRAIITRDREGGNHWFISGYEISEAGRGYRAKK